MWSPPLQANIHGHRIARGVRKKGVNSANGGGLWCKYQLFPLWLQIKNNESKRRAADVTQIEEHFSLFFFFVKGVKRVCLKFHGQVRRPA